MPRCRRLVVLLVVLGLIGLGQAHLGATAVADGPTPDRGAALAGAPGPEGSAQPAPPGSQGSHESHEAHGHQAAACAFCGLPVQNTDVVRAASATWRAVPDAPGRGRPEPAFERPPRVSA